MKAIILAAGYATRLYPLTKNFPKPLLEVGGKTILDYLVDQLKTIAGIDGAYVVTNHRFYGHFADWARTNRAVHTGGEIEVLNDGTTSNDDRLGAVGDIQFAIEARDIADDVLVLAADNILLFSLQNWSIHSIPIPSLILLCATIPTTMTASAGGMLNWTKIIAFCNLLKNPIDPFPSGRLCRFIFIRRRYCPVLKNISPMGAIPTRLGIF